MASRHGAHRSTDRSAEPHPESQPQAPVVEETPDPARRRRNRGPARRGPLLIGAAALGALGVIVLAPNAPAFASAQIAAQITSPATGPAALQIAAQNAPASDTTGATAGAHRATPTAADRGSRYGLGASGITDEQSDTGIRAPQAMDAVAIAQERVRELNDPARQAAVSSAASTSAAPLTPVAVPSTPAHPSATATPGKRSAAPSTASSTRSTPTPSTATAKTSVKTTAEPATTSAAASATSDSDPAPAAGPNAYRAYARGKVGDTQFSCLDALWTKESGWNPAAKNPGSTAYGIPQLLNSTWAATGINKTADGYRQVDAGLVYIDRAYGSPCAAWSHSKSTGWY